MGNVQPTSHHIHSSACCNCLSLLPGLGTSAGQSQEARDAFIQILLMPSTGSGSEEGGLKMGSP